VPNAVPQVSVRGLGSSVRSSCQHSMSIANNARRRLNMLGGNLQVVCHEPTSSTCTPPPRGTRLAGKTAVVTGGGTGIGEAIVRSLYAEGCIVWAVGRRLEPLQGMAAECPGVRTRSVDVADEAAVVALFGEVGRCDILINNAGINIVNRQFSRLDPADFKKVLEINTVGAFNCIHHCVEGAGGMAASQDGLIVNVSSIAGMRTYELSGTAYTASKFAMNALGSAVAAEYRELGIRVTNLCPGEVLTPIMKLRPVQPSAEHLASICQPEDVADCVMLVACLHKRANVPELVIKPTKQFYPA
jgi:NADP-dependent 3-hydroxy acid dehydrogenase YdfG